jgi:hypothetical protein
MAEIVVIFIVVVVFIKKVNQISLLHLEWGLVRLEFAPASKKPPRIAKSIKPLKKITRGT